MLDFSDEASHHEKCYTTIGKLPAFVDPKQPPQKKSPFSAILNHPFVHTTELILPEEIYRAAWESIRSRIKKLQYARVFMPLSSLLEGEFFNTYIKTGDVLMISEGRAGVDDVFSLRNGVLRLELGKEKYERTGLTGKPIRSGGRKHAKERFVVEINLRLPSMLHGKKGFERIVWAFKNVLNHSVSWLFYDLASDSASLDQANSPLKQHHPQIVECTAVEAVHQPILVPPLSADQITALETEEDIRDYCNDISEWLALVSLDSPRVSANDNIDPYLSRYAVPQQDLAKSSATVSLKWHGLIPSQWIIHLFISILRERILREPHPNAWFALSCSALGRDAVESKDGYTILYLPASGSSAQENSGQAPVASEEPASVGEGSSRRHFICWEYVGASLCI
ncbi:hypothetical protein VTN96DRAFT_233 [Rasamsonia emersonii]